MEDVTDLLNRIKNQIGGEESLSDEKLNRQLNGMRSTASTPPRWAPSS